MIISHIIYFFAWVRYLFSNGGGKSANYGNAADNNKTCTTSTCQSSAQRFLANMDPSTNPCDDFHRFACGGFTDSIAIPPDQTHVSAFSQVNNQLQEQLHSLLSGPPAPWETRPHHTMRHLYSLCMDLDGIEARGVGPAVRLLEKAGGWPLLTHWSEAGWNVLEAEIRLRRLALGGGSLFDIGAAADMKRNTRKVISVDQGNTPISRELLVQGPDTPMMQAYHRYMVDMAVLMGADRGVAEKDLWQCILFQVQLAQIMSSQEDRTEIDRMYNPFTLESLQNTIRWIDWYKLIRSIFPKRVHISMEEPVIVLEIEFFIKLKQLLQSFPKRVIANYMMWDVVSGMTDQLTRAVRDRATQFRHSLAGTTSSAPRWKNCIQVASSFSLVISSMYVERFFKNDARLAAREVVRTIRHEMATNIDSISWMEPQTKLKANEKVGKMLEFIGYPDEILDMKKLEKIYKNLALDKLNYLEAMLEFGRWAEDLSLGQLHEPVSRSDWRTQGIATSVNAYYDPMANAILFPAGILQPPFFSPAVPAYVNYATMGTIVGHEITHAFDNMGGQFDGEGNVHNWWDDVSKTNFYKKTQCMIDQYSNFTDNQTGLNLNGRLTQGENVADNAGVRLAYSGWLRVTDGGRGERLPGLQGYNPRQLFMLSLANIWCDRHRTEAMRSLITSDVHAPPKFRVNGVFQNLAAFGEAFHCPRGSPMNPERKCEVW